MDGIYTCDSEETGAACWVRQTVYALMAGTAVLSLLVALAVEVVPAYAAHKAATSDDEAQWSCVVATESPGARTPKTGAAIDASHPVAP